MEGGKNEGRKGQIPKSLECAKQQMYCRTRQTSTMYRQILPEFWQCCHCFLKHIMVSFHWVTECHQLLYQLD